jgi:hypothetical protein
MNETQPNGRSLIAAYRAARLSQRSALRQQSNASLRAARSSLAAPDPTAEATPGPLEPSPAPTPVAAHEPAVEQSIFARLLSHAPVTAPVPPSCAPQGLKLSLETSPGSALAIPNVAGPAGMEPRSGAKTNSAGQPLSVLGFGPGMLIRLGQIGLRTTDDLARANAADLRLALGEISRLADIEMWIVAARRAIACPYSGIAGGDIHAA